MKKQLLYSGKAKEVWSTDNESLLEIIYLDQATALNGHKKDVIVGKGSLNNQISSLIFAYLNQKGIKTHFVKQTGLNQQIVKKVKMLPLEIVTRNVAAGHFCTNFGIEKGYIFEKPVEEFYYKNDELDDPFINEDQIIALGLATPEEINKIWEITRLVNKYLTELFSEIDLDLIDFKLEFGRLATGELILADEFSPDNCRLWKKQTKESLDKDLYRNDSGDLIQAYQTILDKLQTKLRTNVSEIKVRIFVMYKDSVFDPQGDAIQRTFHILDYKYIKNIKVGKFFDVSLQADKDSLDEVIKELSEELLVNFNLETYYYDILEGE